MIYEWIEISPFDIVLGDVIRVGGLLVGTVTDVPRGPAGSTVITFQGSSLPPIATSISDPENVTVERWTAVKSEAVL